MVLRALAHLHPAVLLVMVALLPLAACVERPDTSTLGVDSSDTPSPPDGNASQDALADTSGPVDSASPPDDTAAGPVTLADTMETPAVDRCKNTTDEAVIQADPDAPGAVAAGCGASAGCFGLAFTDLDAFEACVQTCMTDESSGADLSDGCSLCYARTVRCALANCLGAGANCAGAPDGQACIDCRNEHCAPAFFLCTGLTPPAE